MTARSELEQRKRELAGKAIGAMANRGLSRKTTGVDALAKRLIAKQVGEVPYDPELDHPADWDRPVD
ncbi:MAG: hypothetical protein AAGG08_00145 [Actinomycetota bacterium]